MPHNKHAAQYLLGILESERWTESTLAKRAGLARSVVSAHLSGRRVIRRHHIGRYLEVIDAAARLGLFVAWVRDDGFGQEILDALIRAFTGNN